jgi:hypothetical protein
MSQSPAAAGDIDPEIPAEALEGIMAADPRPDPSHTFYGLTEFKRNSICPLAPNWLLVFAS